MTPILGPRSTALSRHFEGCRLRAFRDGGGVWTIGRGHTGPDVHAGLLWTQAAADATFTAELARYAGYVVDMLDGDDATNWQFGALTDACYNAGPGNLAKSPMLALHKAGKFAAAADAFHGWHVHDHEGNLEPGLPLRREAEAALYAGDYAKFDRLIGFPA